jgi:hypothetical protein
LALSRGSPPGPRRGPGSNSASPTAPAPSPRRRHWPGCPPTPAPPPPACRPAGSGNLVYLDATPRQGTETLPGWANFRIAHLRNDDAATATLDAHAEHLKFLGGTGSCVLDDYTTRAGARHFREIACLVQDSNSASVIVAATPATDWSRYRAILEQAVAAYSVR